MPNLNGKIQKEIEINGQIKKTTILNGLVQKVVTLYGSVDRFVRSLTMRFFIQPVASVYVKMYVDRYLKAQIQPNSSIYARFKGLKNLKNIIVQPKSNISVSMRAFKNMKFNIESTPIFGKETELLFLDNLELGDIDDFTLGELEFTEGVYMTVVKSTSLQILGNSELTVDMYIIRYTKLDDIDELTLDDIDEMTLGELDETVL